MNKICARVVSLGAAAAAVLGGVSVGAYERHAAIHFPEGYRTWTHVKSTLVGPGSSFFASNGGLHHFYANEKGLEGYRTGQFPDGSVLIDDLLETKETGGITSEGPRRRLAVMVKDGQAYSETGGWGFEVFKGDTRGGALAAAGRAECFACHTKAKALVFSELRR